MQVCSSSMPSLAKESNTKLNIKGMPLRLCGATALLLFCKTTSLLRETQCRSLSACLHHKQIVALRKPADIYSRSSVLAFQRTEKPSAQIEDTDYRAVSSSGHIQPLG